VLRLCLTCGTPIPAHARRCPAHRGNTSWNGARDRQTQHRFRSQLLEQQGHRCQRCGATDVPLQAHHDSETTGRMLCRPCHKAEDVNAR